MQEKIFEFDSNNPVEIFGVNNGNIDLLKKHFPKLKIIARGNALKVMGSVSELEQFDLVMHDIFKHFNRFNKVSAIDIDRIMKSEGAQSAVNDQEGDAKILHGVRGELIKARTPNQLEMVKSIQKNDMLFAIGPAGTGKTYTAVALAVKALKEKTVKKIVLTRPAVEAGESLGFLPGDVKDKLDPYLQPLYDALRDMIPSDKLGHFLEEGTIQIAPLAFMRGRTLDNAFVILDEAQNASQSQLKMFLTRMGRSAKFIVTGDPTQVDLPKHQPSGLIQALRILKKIEGISFVKLDQNDVIRHKLVKDIIKMYSEEDKNKENV